MSISFRRRVRSGWRQCRRYFHRGDDEGLRDARSLRYSGVEDNRLEMEEHRVGVDAGASRRHASPRPCSTMTAISRNSRRKTGTHLTMMTG